MFRASIVAVCFVLFSDELTAELCKEILICPNLPRGQAVQRGIRQFYSKALRAWASVDKRARLPAAAAGKLPPRRV
jgi:hypothetical protein